MIPRPSSPPAGTASGPGLTGRERDALVLAFVAGRAAGAVPREGALARWVRDLAGRDLEPLAAILAGLASGRTAEAASGIRRLAFRDPASARRAGELSDLLASLDPTRQTRTPPR